MEVSVMHSHGNVIFWKKLSIVCFPLIGWHDFSACKYVDSQHAITWPNSCNGMTHDVMQVNRCPDWIPAHILRVHCHAKIFQKECSICNAGHSGWTGFSMQVNGPKLQVQNSYLSHRWRDFLFILINSYYHNSLRQFEGKSRQAWDHNAL